MNEYIISFNGDYRFLSNFWGEEITYEGKLYPTSEHAYQAAKTLNDNEREMIKNAQGASAAKKMGRKVTLRANWESIKDDIMLDILRIKFSDKILGEKLLKTDDRILVESNYWHDNWFGVCYCDKCKGIGWNRLGQLLMKVREEIKEALKKEVTNIKVDNIKDIPLEAI
jgi:ribA/ribD-fused uncharacterized protein